MKTELKAKLNKRERRAQALLALACGLLKDWGGYYILSPDIDA